MKTAFTLSILLVVTAAMAQNKTEMPRSEFVISLSENSITLKPGESKQVIVSIIRSKSFAKGKATLGTPSVLPQGITLVYEPAEGNFESSVATITTGSTSATGSYQLVLNGTINYKTKGTILKLTVNNENVAIK